MLEPLPELLQLLQHRPRLLALRPAQRLPRPLAGQRQVDFQNSRQLMGRSNLAGQVRNFVKHNTSLPQF